MTEAAAVSLLACVMARRRPPGLPSSRVLLTVKVVSSRRSSSTSR
jgi:hypothetical protein